MESQLKIEEWEYFSLKMINFAQESHILSDLDFRDPIGPNRKVKLHLVVKNKVSHILLQF